jgi:hypothetical protein
VTRRLSSHRGRRIDLCTHRFGGGALIFSEGLSSFGRSIDLSGGALIGSLEQSREDSSQGAALIGAEEH